MVPTTQKLLTIIFISDDNFMLKKLQKSGNTVTSLQQNQKHEQPGCKQTISYPDYLSHLIGGETIVLDYCTGKYKPRLHHYVGL